MFVQNFKILGVVVPEKSWMKNFIGEKEKKWTNKGNDKHEDADFLLHNITCHTQCLYQISKILGAVVPEKSLTEKKLKVPYSSKIDIFLSKKDLIN